MRCTFKWRYDFGFRGNGNAWIVSRGNDVDTRIGFYSEDFNHHAPSYSRVESCSSDINVNDIHFNGGISGTILNLFKKKVKEMIEDEVTDMVCEEMSGMGSDTLSQSLSEISELFEPYLIDGPTQRDPLDAQNSLVVPEGTGKLIDFQNLGNSTPAMLMSWALDEANARFSIHREDESTGETDLGINIMVRSV